MANKAKQRDFSRRLDNLSLLKASETRYAESPEYSQLETFGNVYADRDYIVTFDCQEFTALCPVTGQPDFGIITIRYIPDKSCVESKSLKLYLYSFRNHNTFHEEAVNMILDELVAKCSPRKAEVIGVFRPRGGIAIHVKATFGGKIDE
jgi:7-cyano-7-deazaguanine reductase